MFNMPRLIKSLVHKYMNVKAIDDCPSTLSREFVIKDARIPAKYGTYFHRLARVGKDRGK